MSSSTRLRRPAAETRQHILDVATDLFYWDGIRATGVDRVAAKAGVGPTTLYRAFASKDELVAAYVGRLDADYRAWLDEITAPAIGSPRERILNLFAAMEEATGPEDCRGCPFLMTLAEFPDPGAPAHIASVATKAHVRAVLGALTAELPGSDGEALADGLALLMEGIYGSIQALGQTGPAARATATAAALIDASA